MSVDVALNERSVFARVLLTGHDRPSKNEGKDHHCDRDCFGDCDIGTSIERYVAMFSTATYL